MPAARPILFSAPMIRALLDGRKTQTRRILKQAHDTAGKDTAWAVCPAKESGWIAWFGQPRKAVEQFTKEAYGHGFPCPYGHPGDLLWVRESFGYYCSFMGDVLPNAPILYRADQDSCGQYPVVLPGEKDITLVNDREPWKPSIHMPRLVSRLTLEITDVRVERLQDISEADAMAEGIDIPLPDKYGCPYRSPKHSDGKHRIGDNAYTMYRDLWNDIHGKDAWQQNPWIWALTFKVNKRNVDALLSQKAA
jgi:hypothetical protein